MHSSSTLVPLLHHVLPWLDAPARSAQILARRPLWRTVLLAMSGGALIALSFTAAGALLDPATSSRWLRPERILSAFFAAVILVLPSSVPLALSLRLRVPGRVLVAAYALGLLASGVVSLCMVPFFAYLGLVSRAQPLASPLVLLPLLALGAIISTLDKVLSSLGRDRLLHLFSCGVSVALPGLFLFSLWAR